MFTFQHLPVEIGRLLMKEVVPALENAKEHIAHHNYGLASQAIEQALGDLPMDFGETIQWPSAERVTTA